MYFRNNEILVVDGRKVSVYSAETLEEMRSFVTLEEDICDLDCLASGLVVFSTWNGAFVLCSHEGNVRGRVELGTRGIGVDPVRLNPDGSWVAAVKVGAVLRVPLRDGSPRSHEGIEEAALKVDCRGLNLAGTTGLSNEQRAFFLERGAVLERGHGPAGDGPHGQPSALDAEMANNRIDGDE